ncbi:MAG: TRAP transporter substrate-binding protein DctP [Gemmatimonadota bacterium]|nr:TRAP transporter substrate-binding protein DctP [Gemmatimonadota bacterium]
MSDEAAFPDRVWTRRRLLGAAAGAAVVAPFVRGNRHGRDDATVLRYTSHVPRSHGLYRLAYVPFAEIVERETGGRVRFDPYMDRLLHGPLGGFKACVTGITDYTHGYATYQPGSFHLTHALQLPFFFDSPQVAALVAEELYPTYFRDEYERLGVYLAHCDATTPYDIISTTPIETTADVRGKKIRVTGGLTEAVFRELGAIPVVMAAAETYLAFQRGIIDAVALGVPDMLGYRLFEVGRYLTTVRINVTVLQYCLNRRTFDALPDDLKRQMYGLFRVRGQLAVQNYYGGARAAEAIEDLRERGIEILAPAEADLAEWRAALEPLRERFLSEQEARGLPARRLAEDMAALAARYRGWSDEELMNHVRTSPVQGIIEL